MATASDVSRAGRFCYIMHAISPQVRSFAYPSSFLSLLFFLPGILVFSTNSFSNNVKEVASTQRIASEARRAFSTAGYVSREDYHYCGVTMRTHARILGYINSAETDIPREDEPRGNYCIRMYMRVDSCIG